MARTDCLGIRFGNSRWLSLAQTLVASLGLLAILATAASWEWKFSGILLLLLVSVLVYAWGAHGSRSGVIRLFEDGTVLFRTASRQEINAVQGEHGWVSRWCSILTLHEADNGRKHYCVICASENHPDDYRRLLKHLRMRTATAKVQRMIW